MDVFETERQVWIIAALPGVAPEAVRVDIEGPTLTRLPGSVPSQPRAGIPML